MNRTALWFFMSFKRQLRRPFFLLLLVLIPVGMGLFNRAEEESSGRIPIALHTEGDGWNEKVAAVLKAESGPFDFYLCETKEKLEADVAAGRAECGYVFPTGLKELLDKGDYRRKLLMVVSPATVAAQLASETVFAGLFGVYGRELLMRYANEGAVFAPLAAGRGSVWRELEPLYDQYLENGSTFAFEYGTVSGGMIESETVTAVFPIRGIAAVFVFVIGLSAAVTAAADERGGLFAAVEPSGRTLFILAQTAAPVLLSCLSAFLCLAAAGDLREPVWEMARLVGYGILVTLFSCAGERLLKSPLILSGLIPFFIIGSLAACPVFADLSVFLPVLRTVRLFFLPYYYLIG